MDERQILDGLRSHISPNEMPEPSQEHPGPWKAWACGNGHFNIIDAHGIAFVHVFCWDRSELDEMNRRIAATQLAR